MVGRKVSLEFRSQEAAEKHFDCCVFNEAPNVVKSICLLPGEKDTKDPSQTLQNTQRNTHWNTLSQTLPPKKNTLAAELPKSQTGTCGEQGSEPEPITADGLLHYARHPLNEHSKWLSFLSFSFIHGFLMFAFLSLLFRLP